MYSNISISKLKSIGNDIKLIDIRDESVFNKGNIPNSINIPVYKLISDPDFYLKKDNTYYIYCHNGCSSLYTCQILDKKGYKVINVLGGYKKWLKEEENEI
jgi:rhodanese-related sulfurtransferase